jgi:hypothetical protein
MCNNIAVCIKIIGDVLICISKGVIRDIRAGCGMNITDNPVCSGAVSSRPDAFIYDGIVVEKIDFFYLLKIVVNESIISTKSPVAC